MSRLEAKRRNELISLWEHMLYVESDPKEKKRFDADKRAAEIAKRDAEVIARWESEGSRLDERSKRLFAAREALRIGYGGVSLMCRVTGLCRNTIKKGIRDLDNPIEPGRVRRPGAGRPKRLKACPLLAYDLIQAVNSHDERPSFLKLSKMMKEMGHDVSKSTVRLSMIDIGLYTPPGETKLLEA